MRQPRRASRRRPGKAALLAPLLAIAIGSLLVSEAWVFLHVLSAPRATSTGRQDWPCGLCGRSVDSATPARIVACAAGKYRALTRIRIREAPDVASKPTGQSLEPGEVFEAGEVVPGSEGGISYLSVAGKGGWVFDHGIAGRWVGRPIVEQMAEPAAPAEVAGPVPAAAPSPAPASPPATATAPTPPATAPAPAASAPATAAVEPVVALATARVQMLRLPDNMLGAGFELLQLEVAGGRQPLTFMLASGFPKNAVTWRGKELAGQGGEAQYSGGWLSAASKDANQVELKGVKVPGSGVELGDLGDCIVLDFPQAQLAQQLGVEVHGLLGQPFFASHDLDLDRYGGRLHIFSPGLASAQGFYSNVKYLPGVSLPSGNLGVVVKGTKVDRLGVDVEAEEEAASGDAIFMGMLDTGAAHTVINWEAAKLLGYSGPEDRRLVAATKVLGAGSDGTAQEMPVVLAKFSLCAVPEGTKTAMAGVSKEEWESTGGGGWYFKDLEAGEGCMDFGAVNVAIGDVLSLTVMRDSKIGEFKGAAAVVGQDLLFQAQRVIVNARDTQIWLEPGEVSDAPEM